MVHSGAVFATLFTVLSLTTSCGGAVFTATGGGATPIQPVISTISVTDAAIAVTPYISGNTVQYYCDCTGAGQTCAIAAGGSNSTGNGTQGSPYQTIGAAMTWVSGGIHRTAALCRGGSFPAANNGPFGMALGVNATCTTGTICNEIREYPVNGSGAKPIVINLPGSYYLFSTINGGGGYRFMNLKLQGTPTSPSGGQNLAFFLYVNASMGRPSVHDIAIENVDMDSFDLGVDDVMNTVNANSNITVLGNHFTNNTNWGYLGSSSNLIVNYNAFVNSGNDNTFDHSLYFSTTFPVTNVSIVGNYITGFSTMAGNTTCMGGPFVGHAAVNGLTVSGNVVVESTTANAACWGLSFTDTTSTTDPIFLKNALFSNNIIVNGGNTGIAIDNCPYCVIENNLVIFQNNQEAVGISSPNDISRTQDVAESNARIVNNTIYYETTSTQGMKGGVGVGAQGTGYIIANNTVMYAGSTHGSNASNCFTYSLPLASYSFINNNNCYSNDAATRWVLNGVTQYPLANWQAYAAGKDTASSYTNPGWSSPLTIPALNEFTTGAQLFAPYFTPWVGSPLLRTGNAANASVLDIANIVRSAVAPNIGAYEGSQ